jgi:hypothetical protein
VKCCLQFWILCYINLPCIGTRAVLSMNATCDYNAGTTSSAEPQFSWYFRALVSVQARAAAARAQGRCRPGGRHGRGRLRSAQGDALCQGAARRAVQRRRRGRGGVVHQVRFRCAARVSHAHNAPHSADNVLVSSAGSSPTAARRWRQSWSRCSLLAWRARGHHGSSSRSCSHLLGEWQTRSQTCSIGRVRQCWR